MRSFAGYAQHVRHRTVGRGPGRGNVKRYAVIPGVLLGVFALAAYVSGMFHQPLTRLPDVVFLSTVYWLFPVGPTVFVSLALATRTGVVRRRASLEPTVSVAVWGTVRGLSAAALWLSCLLVVYFWAAWATVSEWLPLGRPASAATAMVMGGGDLAAAALVTSYGLVLAAIVRSGDGSVTVGRELTIAHAITLAGLVPPALAALSYLKFANGW